MSSVYVFMLSECKLAVGEPQENSLTLKLFSVSIRKFEHVVYSPRTRLVSRAQPEGLVWFPPEGVVILDTD